MFCELVAYVNFISPTGIKFATSFLTCNSQNTANSCLSKSVTHCASCVGLCYRHLLHTTTRWLDIIFTSIFLFLHCRHRHHHHHHYQLQSLQMTRPFTNSVLFFDIICLKVFALAYFVSLGLFSGSSRTFSLGDQWGPWFLVRGIQSEQLQVSYYELYCASLWL